MTLHSENRVFNKDGDVIFSKSKISLGNLVKDVAESCRKQRDDVVLSCHEFLQRSSKEKND